jgi:transcription initiation factor IIE alpha subunit
LKRMMKNNDARGERMSQEAIIRFLAYNEGEKFNSEQIAEAIGVMLKPTQDKLAKLRKWKMIQFEKIDRKFWYWSGRAKENAISKDSNAMEAR